MTELLIAKNVRRMVPSATLAMAAAARELADAGVDVVSLSAGEPDFATPASICEIGKAGIDKGKTHYVAVRGIKSMISALQYKFERDQGVSYKPSEVMCTVGAKAAIMMALHSIIEEGDEVIVFAPYWVSYWEQICLLGGIPKVVKCKAEHDFMPMGEDLRRAISPKTKAIILNSPNNPSGGVISLKQLQEIAEVLSGTGIWVVSDEIYEKLLFDGVKHYSPAKINEDMRRRTIVVSGASKGYAMTGWRVGFAAGDQAIITAMGNLQGQETTCLPEFIQDAAVYALREDSEISAQIQHMTKAYAHRRSLFLRLFLALPELKIFKPQGAFYVWVDFSAYIGRIIAGLKLNDDLELATRMLKEAHVAAVPGTPFGAPGFMRFSIASAESDIEKAFERISTWLR